MDSLPLEFFDFLLDERNRGIVSEEEAIRRLRVLPPLSAADAEAAADRVKEPPPLHAEPEMVLLQDMGIGAPFLFSTLEDRHNHFLLVHESIRPRDGSSLGSHRAVRDCLTATIDLLTERHDPAIIDRATQLAERYVADAGSARALNLAGRVHFEPYSLSAGSRSYEHDVALRDFRRAWAVGVTWAFDPNSVQRSGPDASTLPGFRRFPGYDESLERAAGYFRRAADLDDGIERGRALAYLAILDLTRALTGRSVDVRQVGELLDEADRLLPRRDDPTIWARLWLFAGDLRDPSVLFRNRIPVRNAGLMIAEHGLQSTAWLYLTAMEIALGARNNAEAVTFARLLQPFLPRTGMEQARLHLRSMQLHSLPGDPTGCEQHLTGVPPETFLDYGQTATAIHALAHARYGKRTLDRVELAVGDSDGPLRDSFRLARTASFDPIGALRGQNTDPLDLADAVIGYLIEGCPDTATLCLVALAQHAEHSTGETEADLVLLLIRLSGLISGAGVLLSDQGHRLLRDTLFQVAALAAQQDQPRRDATWLAVHQLAKGYVLASALRGNRRAQDSHTIHVSQVLRVRGTTGFELPGRFWQVGSGNEAQLAAPVTFREARSGVDGAEASANWRRVYHRTLARDLARAAMATDAPLRGLNEVMTALGDSACLLSLLTGNLEQRGYGNVIAAELVTGHITKVVIIGSAEPIGLLGTMIGNAEHGVIDVSVLFGMVPSLLAAIQEDALTRDVSREAEVLLNDQAEALSPLLRWLTELDPGVTTLYLWPHEAAHVLPFWLLPLGNGIVADRFTVSVLPCLEPLFRAGRETGIAAEKAGILAVASAGGGLRYGLPYEESVEDSASKIAAMFECEALTGEQATPEKFLARAGSTPYIHLAAHGIQDPDAPMFHCLFLSGEDGRLFADQILQCDLRTVRLVTIEACESMLVRYDHLDNVIGLPSILLRAGAGSVVGASWLVRPEVSALFFMTFYQHLRRSDGIGAAFSKAQRHTRQAYPQYADWGAFRLTGYAG